jgi:hypothetical protein
MTSVFPAALTEVPVAEWAAAIDLRHSSRTYSRTMVAHDLMTRMLDFCSELPGKQVARVVVVPEAPRALFTGLVGGYGKVLDAPSALLMIGRESVAAVQESLGYLGEAAILQATSLGLGTCWVAGSYDRDVADRYVRFEQDERVYAVSPLGNAKPRARAGEQLLKRVVGAHKRRAVEAVAPGFDARVWPAWAAEGVRLAVIAPSAINRQPWRFDFESANPDSMLISVVEKGMEGHISRRLDCGIAMLHFEVGARLLGANGTWEILAHPQVARFRLGP